MAIKIMKKLEGKSAVITGGNSGIGLVTAKKFVEEDAYVFITGRRQSELDIAVKQIGKIVIGVQGDVSNLADLDKLYATVKQDKGSIDILFANAGLGEFAPLPTITEAHNLAEVLKGLVEDMKCERKFVGLREGQKPFVEVDERYRGVTIMNIIHLKTGTST